MSKPQTAAQLELRRGVCGRLCVPPAARGNHALAETMIMERISAAHRKRGHTL